MGIVLVPAFFIYISLSAFIFWQVKKKAKSKKTIWGTVLILFLLPTWDVVIASLVYLPASVFWSGDQIHRTVETDSVYYDDYHYKRGVYKSTKDSFFFNHIKFVEMEVKDIKKHRYIKKTGYYRYWFDINNKFHFDRIESIQSQYMIKMETPKGWPNVLLFHERKVIDRKTNEIIASRKNVELTFIPFFNWLDAGSYDYLPKIYSNNSPYHIEKRVINYNFGG